MAGVSVTSPGPPFVIISGISNNLSMAVVWKKVTMVTAGINNGNVI